MQVYGNENGYELAGWANGLGEDLGAVSLEASLPALREKLWVREGIEAAEMAEMAEEAEAAE